MSALRTPDEWLHLYPGIQILDQDGWRGPQARPFTDPISKQEFEGRLRRCTLNMQPFSDEQTARIDAAADAIKDNGGWQNAGGAAYSAATFAGQYYEREVLPPLEITIRQLEDRLRRLESELAASLSKNEWLLDELDDLEEDYEDMLDSNWHDW